MTDQPLSVDVVLSGARRLGARLADVCREGVAIARFLWAKIFRTN